MVKYAPRTCLSCGEAFLSEGPWNRICGDCRERNTVYAYNRSSGSSLGTTEGENQDSVVRELEPEEAANL